jgi:Domain of unknown function (DUF4188)
MATIHQGRYSAEIEGDFVVFLIGIRLNRPWKVHHWWPVFTAMPRMLRELRRHPEQGLLGALLALIGGPAVVQYWRSFEHLDRFARDPAALHLPTWRWYNRALKASGDVGIWHETYLVPTGRYEAIYGNMPRMGLAAAGGHVVIARRGQSAAERVREKPSTSRRCRSTPTLEAPRPSVLALHRTCRPWPGSMACAVAAGGLVRAPALAAACMSGPCRGAGHRRRPHRRCEAGHSAAKRIGAMASDDVAARAVPADPVAYLQGRTPRLRYAVPPAVVSSFDPSNSVLLFQWRIRPCRATVLALHRRRRRSHGNRLLASFLRLSDKDNYPTEACASSLLRVVDVSRPAYRRRLHVQPPHTLGRCRYGRQVHVQAPPVPRLYPPVPYGHMPRSRTSPGSGGSGPPPHHTSRKSWRSILRAP